MCPRKLQHGLQAVEGKQREAAAAQLLLLVLLAGQEIQAMAGKQREAVAGLLLLLWPMAAPLAFQRHRRGLHLCC